MVNWPKNDPSWPKKGLRKAFSSFRGVSRGPERYSEKFCRNKLSKAMKFVDRTRTLHFFKNIYVKVYFLVLEFCKFLNIAKW